MSSPTRKIRRFLLVVVFGIMGTAGALIPQSRIVRNILTGAALPLPKASSVSYQGALPSSPLTGLTWVRTGGPIGGMGYDIRVRPDNPDFMYVTDATAGVHKSIDGGRTWFPLNDGIDTRSGPSGDAIPVFSLTIDPNNYDIIWVGTINARGVYRSEDAGKTWQKRVNGIVEDNLLEVRGFAIQPGNSDVVFCAGDVSTGHAGRSADMVHGVIYKTTDAGLHWRAVWRGDNLARYVLFDPTNLNTIYASTGIFDREAANANPATLDPGGVGILKSADGGETWTAINNGLDELYIGSLFMHPLDPQVLIAGAGNANYPGKTGAYLTTDGGAHWQRVLTSRQQITSVEFSASNPNVVYAAGDLEFYRSDDGGSTWNDLTPPKRIGWGPEGIKVGIPIDFQVDPRDPKRIFANNYEGGNLISNDGGGTWELSTNGYTGAIVYDVAVDPRNPATIYTNGKNGPFKSTDGGQTWKGLNSVFPQTICGGARIVLDPLHPDHVLMSAAREGWAYESTNGGNSWTVSIDYRNELWSQPGGNSINNWQGLWAVAFAPSRPEKVYGGFAVFNCVIDTREGLCSVPPMVSLLLSEDGGHSWSRRKGTALDGHSITDILVHPTNADAAWAATGDAGLFRTFDGGLTWQSSSSGLSGMVMTLALDPQRPDVLYAGTAAGGTFKSEDGGVTWRQSSAGMNPNESINSVVVDPLRPNVVYAGSRSSGVFVSENAGASWRSLNSGLRTRSIQKLAISSDGNLLYAATAGEGVFWIGTLPGPAKRLSFPTIANDSLQSTGLAICNISAQPADLTFKAYSDSGILLASSPKTLQAGRQLAQLVGEIFPTLGQAIGWLSVESNVANVFGFFVLFNPTLTTMDGADVGGPLMQDFIIPELQNAEISLANPSSTQSATVTISSMSSRGEVKDTKAINITPQGRFSKKVGDLFASTSVETGGYLSVSSTLGLAGNEFFGAANTDLAALNPISTAGGAKLLYSPQYVVGGTTWMTTLGLINLEDSSTTVSLSLRDSNGDAIGQTAVIGIPAHAKAMITDPGIFGINASGPEVAGFLRISSDTTRVAGYIRFGDQNGTRMQTALPLLAQGCSDVVYSQVAQDDTYFTGVTIVNPNVEAAKIDLSVYDTEGRQMGGRSLMIPPNARVSKTLLELVSSLPALSGGYFRVKSDRPTYSFAVFGTNSLSVVSAITAIPLN